MSQSGSPPHLHKHVGWGAWLNMSQAPIFDLELSSTSMLALLYRNVVSLRKEDMMDDGKVDFSTFTYLMWRPVKSKLQPRYKWTLQSGGGRLLQGARLLNTRMTLRKFPLGNVKFLFGSLSHLTRGMTEQSWMDTLTERRPWKKNITFYCDFFKFKVKLKQWLVLIEI